VILKWHLVFPPQVQISAVSGRVSYAVPQARERPLAGNRGWLSTRRLGPVRVPATSLPATRRLVQTDRMALGVG
jgi:hypothetical protein